MSIPESIIRIVDLFFVFLDYLESSIDFLTNIADIIEFWIKLICEFFVFVFKLFVYQYEKISKNFETQNNNSVLNFKHFCCDFTIENLFLIFIFFTFFLLILSIVYLKYKLKRLRKINLMLKNSSSSQNCVICLQEKSCILLMPCKHLCVCKKCFDLFKKNGNYFNCPLCRTRIQNELEIFG